MISRFGWATRRERVSPGRLPDTRPSSSIEKHYVLPPICCVDSSQTNFTISTSSLRVSKHIQNLITMITYANPSLPSHRTTRCKHRARCVTHKDVFFQHPRPVLNDVERIHLYDGDGDGALENPI